MGVWMLGKAFTENTGVSYEGGWNVRFHPGGTIVNLQNRGEIYRGGLRCGFDR